MLARYKCILLIHFLVVIFLSECTQINGILDPNNPNDPVLILPGMKLSKGVRSEGVFERFLRKYLDLLSTNFPERKLIRYCRVLSRHLEVMEFRHTKRLAAHVRHLSRMYRDDLKNEISKYRRELDRNLPQKTEFVEAMNQIFTLRENQLFEDYLYDLRDYGNEDKLYIDDETRKLLNDVIVGNILKASEQDQKSLFKKLREAIKEYSSQYE